MQDAGRKMQDAGRKMQDAGRKMQNFRNSLIRRSADPLIR